MNKIMLESRAEAVNELQAALFSAAGKTLSRHGNDPDSEAILAAGIAMFISRTDRLLCPGFQRKMIELLSRDAVGTPKERTNGNI